MPECSGAPKESKPARLNSRPITTSCAKLPPTPPYSSGIAGQRSPAAPALVQTSRSYIPCSFQVSRCGTYSVAIKRRACSSSSTRSSVIQPGRGRLRTFMINPLIAHPTRRRRTMRERRTLTRDRHFFTTARADEGTSFHGIRKHRGRPALVDRSVAARALRLVESTVAAGSQKKGGAPGRGGGRQPGPGRPGHRLWPHEDPPLTSSSTAVARSLADIRVSVPGLLLSSAVAIGAMAAARLIAGFAPIPAMVIALGIGIALNPLAQRRVFQSGLVFCLKTILRWAVALLGLRIALGEIVALGLTTAILVVVAMAATLAAGFLLARLFALERAYGALAGA